MASTVTIFPTPGTFQDKPLATFMSSRPGDLDHWPAICRWAANLFSADEDEIDLREVFWGGEYGDDHYREALTVSGKIVGVFDEALTADEWAAMLAADAAEIERKKIAEMHENVAAIQAAMPAACAVSPTVAAIWGGPASSLPLAAE